jgi:seryl-tRNA synthetase
MLDPNLIAEQPELVKQHLERRRADPSMHSDLDRIVALSARRLALISERDTLRADRNTLSKEIGNLYKAGRSAEADAMKETVNAGNVRTKVIEDELVVVEEQRRALTLGLPNLLHPSVPDGKGDVDNREVRRWGTPRLGEGEGEAHVEVGQRLGILDFERAAKLSGSRFAVLVGAGARLERALINFFLDQHTEEHGYTEVLTPYMVKSEIAEGTGQLPKFASDMFKLAEPLNGQDVYLIPTAEVPVTNLHRDEILEEDQLPVRYACFSPCFRSEAGSAGRDVRGLIRVHQFHKVELVWFSHPDQAEADHQALLGHAERMLQQLGLPYRVMELCSGDISFAAHRCYDLEVWLPSQGFREISSVSHFGDFQARRMGLRFRPNEEGGKKGKPRAAHTLNGSGLAVGRTLVAILENYQQADGSVIIPEVLRPYMGGMERIVPRSP